MESQNADSHENVPESTHQNGFLTVDTARANSKGSSPDSSQPTTPQIMLNKESYIWTKDDIVHSFVDELCDEESSADHSNQNGTRLSKGLVYLEKNEQESRQQNETKSPLFDLTQMAKVFKEISKGGEEHNMASKGEEEEDPCPFRPFTQQSYVRLEEREAELKKKEAENKGKPKEGKLVDGELIFNDEDEESLIEKDPAYADGNKVPDELGEIPPNLIGKPLEELDKYIKHKTFVVVNKRIKKKLIFRFSATKALFFLSPWHPIRRFMVYVATNQFLDYFITLTILVNLVFLSFPEPDQSQLSPEDYSRQYTINKSAEYVFLVIYSLEFIIKVCARGFILNKYTYLRDGWNWLDFIVVVLSYVTEIMDAVAEGGPALSGIRAFRVFRALKAVSIFPGLKTIIGALLKSFRMLAEVMLLTIFVMMIFALLALQVYMGALRQKCVKDPWPIFIDNSSHLHAQYAAWINDSSNYLLNGDGEAIICGNASGSIRCPANYTCLQAGENPNNGYTSYDNFAWAMLSICQLVTLDFWEDQYNKIIFASGPWNILFFMMVVFFGSFYLVNLMLAVVAMSYDEEADNTDKTLKDEAQNEEKRKAEKLKEKSSQVSLTKSVTENSQAETSSQMERREKEQKAANAKKSAVFKYDTATLKQQVLEKQKAKEKKKKQNPSGSAGSRRSEDSTSGGADDANNVRKSRTSLASHHEGSAEITERTKSSEKLNGSTANLSRADAPNSELKVTDLEKGETESFHEKDDTVGDLVASNERRHMSPTPTSKTQLSMDNPYYRGESPYMFSRKVSTSGVEVDTDSQGEQTYDENMAYEENVENQTAEMEKELENDGKEPVKIIAQEVDDHGELIEYPRDGSVLVDRNCRPVCVSCCNPKIFENWLRFQNGLYVFITHSAVDSLIVGCIIVNTLSMMVEHHNMDKQLETGLEALNLVITIVFILECVLKILAMSKFYFKNGWNIFDFVVVLASIVEFPLSNLPGFSAIRTLRLLRIFKLAQSWTTMRLLLSIILDTLGALTNLTLILVIVLYIFAILGMQLYGKNYTEANFAPEPVPRWHFKDAPHSFLMVFRILCGEWIEPLWDCLKVGDGGCYPLFLVTLVFGNYIVLNLFLAMLLNSFGSDSLRENDDSEVKDKEESKVKKLLASIRLACSCGRCCCRKQRAISPSVHDLKMSSRASLTYSNKSLTVDDEKEASKDHMDLEANKVEDGTITATTPTNNGKLLSANGDRTPAVKFTISATWSESETDGDAMITNGLELQPVNSNGEVATEQKPANGILKSSKSIDQAFSTQRDQFAKFDSAMKASENRSSPFASRSKVSTNEDQPTPVVIVTSEEDGEKCDKMKSEEDGECKEGDDKESVTEKDGEESKGPIVVEDMDDIDDDMVLHDCCPKCCYKPKCWRSYEGSNFETKFTKFRGTLLKVVEHKAFEGIVIVLIILSSLSLCFEDIYLEEYPIEFQLTIKYSNYVFAALFTLEMVIKWISQGFKVYFSNGWSILDFIIVSISIVSIVVDTLGFKSSVFRALRAFRALRPLRVISRYQGMKVVVNALLFAIPSLVNVLLVCFVFWLIFSIMGMQVFKGKFYKCIDDDGAKINCSIIPNKTECLANNYTWTNSKVNFDNVFVGLLALFQIATFEGWMEIMEDATDMRSEEIPDLQPCEFASEGWYVFFLMFIIVGTFFTLNLFIGVIIDNFNTLKKKYDGTALDIFLTASQKNYYNTMKQLGKKKPQKTIRRPKNKFQAFFFDIAVSTKFEITIVICILINMVMMMFEHYGEPPDFTDILEKINIGFTAIFTVEAIIKIIGLRLHYFRRPWNVFDFIVVVLSLIGVILADLLTNVFITPTLLRVVRVFRIGRVLRLIKAAKGIRKLLFALFISLPALVNIASLLILFMFVFSIIGMALFSDVKKDGIFFNEIVNFETFPNSMVLLFRIATAAGWNEVLDPLLISEPDCDPNFKTLPNGTKVESDGGDCGNYLAIPFLMIYILITFMIIINMYIAIILENFNQAHEQEEIGITEDDFDMFYVVWERFDPHATQFIKYDQLSSFVHELDDPLGIPKPNEIALVAFNLPIVEGDKLHCLDVLVALIKKVLGEVEESDEFKELKTQMEDKFREAFPTRVNTVIKSTTMQRKKEDVAAKTLQRSWRRHKIQKNMKQISEMALELSRTRSTSSDSRNGSAISVRSTASHTPRSPAGNTLTVPGANSHRNSITSLSDG